MELLVTYHLKKGSAEEFLRKLGKIGVPGLVRSEHGCIRYDYYVPAEENGTLILLEEWESAELQALHLEQSHMKRLAQIKPDYVADTEVMVIRQ
jgi:quinol monooxygenase YgiN